jgi:hypothetical protein
MPQSSEAGRLRRSCWVDEALSYNLRFGMDGIHSMRNRREVVDFLRRYGAAIPLPLF